MESVVAEMSISETDVSKCLKRRDNSPLHLSANAFLRSVSNRVVPVTVVLLVDETVRVCEG